MRRTLSALCLSTALGLATALPTHAAGAPVTPTAPTVVDQCGLGQDRVTIPDITGVQYLVEIEGTVVQLTAGDYAGVAFLPWDEIADEEAPLDEESDLTLPDARATITAEALDGYELAGDAVTSFDITLSSAPCASDHSPVTATTSCGQITFANPAGNPEALVYWGDEESDEPEELRVPAGSQRTVDAAAGSIAWFAMDAAIADDEDEAAWATRGATTPDAVATEQDREDLIATAELFDLILAPGLGDGFVEVAACTVPEPEGTTPPAPAPAPTTTPVIPAVVQTDGPAQHSPVGPLALGGLAALAGFLVLRPRRQD
ncbi:hypothetical protein ASG73_14095 [Janibacter sp. Soil728]|uniref:hypothetical protein n=1 Tax=Janibacter sp. Soil728 TaxID=1736393 RepID=UPI0006FA4651|nr:hypothetical protein [Janibacter sp. Soil728]KRE35820.1 hypothetical protein ASG73_14095 [Janibacter sp. Soil728]